ncbi:MAG: DoxX family protein [Phycisphaeraceae bacterium JB051]
MPTQKTTSPLLFSLTDLGMLLPRIMVGFVMFFHGTQKLFGWFGGYGVDGTAGFFQQLGIPFPKFNVYMAGGTELFGGILLALGLATRPAATLLTFTMIVAIVTAHRSAFAAANGGMEYPLTLAVVTLGYAIAGPGKLAVGNLIPTIKQRPALQAALV